MTERDDFYRQEDEVDLIELLQTIWKGKWLILKTICICVVLVVFTLFVLPESYRVSAQLSPGAHSIFIKYTPLNRLLDKNQFDYVIGSDVVFSMFIDEFNDYEEMQKALSSNDFVINHLEGLNEIEKGQKIVDYAKLFVITPPKLKKTNWSISYQWHDVLEGRLILSKAIANVLQKVRATIVSDIYYLAKEVKAYKQRERDMLSNKLASIVEIGNLEHTKRIQFLSEQSKIAEALGLEVNMLDAKELKNSSGNGVALQIMSKDTPFYLRGYKSINQEISLLSHRTKEQRHLMSSGYVEVKRKLRELESDLSEKQLLDNLKIINTDDVNRWISVNLDLAETKQRKRPIVFIVISILVGGMLGVMYVLVAAEFARRRESLGDK